MLPTQPLNTPSSAKGGVAADIVEAGQNIPPLDRLRIMSDRHWEDFVQEWAHSLKSRYQVVERCAGAGDMGRDIVAYVGATANSQWDNYQCKHYDSALTPDDIWIELGKLCYYTYVGEYTFPREYFFVAPRGAGNKLSKLLRDAITLKKGLLDVWNDKCRNKITTTKEIYLDSSFHSYITQLNFSAIRALSPLLLIEQHRTTPWHAFRFGGGLPDRQQPPPPPVIIAPSETRYIRALLDAYEDKLNALLPTPSELQDLHLNQHFVYSRRQFYSAEALREFSKENVPVGTFEDLQEEILEGVLEVMQRSHCNGYERVLSVVQQAKLLSLASNGLFSRVKAADKGGICHQLANEAKLQWRE